MLHWFRTGLLLIGLAAGPVSAHCGDTVTLIQGMTPAEESDIDLGDGTLEDWPEFIQTSYLTDIDFHDTGAVGGVPNPLDLAYRVLMAWSPATQRIYVGVERVDDVYVNNYADDGWNGGLIYLQDSVAFMVDGDHSGGVYGWEYGREYTEVEALSLVNRTAQKYEAIAVAGSKPSVRLSLMLEPAPWANHPPFADGGGFAFGEAPNLSVIEFYVTPFDELLWEDQSGSQVSRLEAGNLIGFAIDMPDFDESPGSYESRFVYPGPSLPYSDANCFADGELLAPPMTTAVNRGSWARIKAALR